MENMNDASFFEQTATTGKNVEPEGTCEIEKVMRDKRYEADLFRHIGKNCEEARRRRANEKPKPNLDYGYIASERVKDSAASIEIERGEIHDEVHKNTCIFISALLGFVFGMVLMFVACAFLRKSPIVAIFGVIIVQITAIASGIVLLNQTSTKNSRSYVITTLITNFVALASLFYGAISTVIGG